MWSGKRKLRSLSQQKKDRKRNAVLMRTYGISLDDYKKIHSNQTGRCAICLNNLEKLHVDHCHITGKVRGLLCQKCNTVLGLVKEDAIVLKSVIDYLKRTK